MNKKELSKKILELSKSCETVEIQIGNELLSGMISAEVLENGGINPRLWVNGKRRRFKVEDVQYLALMTTVFDKTGDLK